MNKNIKNKPNKLDVGVTAEIVNSQLDEVADIVRKFNSMNEKEVLKEIDERIVKWWNANVFFGYEIEEAKDIIDCINEFNHECEKNSRSGYKNIEEMIAYHYKESEKCI